MGKPFTSPVEMYLVIVAVVTPMTLIAMNMAEEVLKKLDVSKRHGYSCRVNGSIIA